MRPSLTSAVRNLSQIPSATAWSEETYGDSSISVWRNVRTAYFFCTGQTFLALWNLEEQFGRKTHYLGDRDYGESYKKEIIVC
jgi:hypothetical protein